MPLSQKLAESVNGLYSVLSSQFPFGPVLPRPLKDRYPKVADLRKVPARDVVSLLSQGKYISFEEFEIPMTDHEFKFLLPRMLELLALGELRGRDLGEKLFAAIYQYHPANADAWPIFRNYCRELFRMILASWPRDLPRQEKDRSDCLAPFTAEHCLCIFAYGRLDLSDYVGEWERDQSLTSLAHLAVLIEEASYESRLLGHSEWTFGPELGGEVNALLFWSAQVEKLSQLEAGFFKCADDDPELAQLLSDAAQTLKCMYQAHRDHLREGQLFHCDYQEVYCLPHKCAYCSLIVGVCARSRE